MVGLGSVQFSLVETQSDWLLTMATTTFFCLPSLSYSSRVLFLFFCCFMEAQSGKKRFICFHLGVWISRCWCLNVCLLYWVSVEILFFFFYFCIIVFLSCELKLLSHVNGSFKGLGHRGCLVIDDQVFNKSAKQYVEVS